jgi:hypothetical protein
VQFVSEAIQPLGEGFDTDAMGRGEPGLPYAFTWRDQTLTVAEIITKRKGTKVDRGDTYVKRHYFDVKLSDGRNATIYFERQAKPNQPRWWLYTIDTLGHGLHGFGGGYS